ncbi:MAG TPA: putative 2-aminoethylphosphonate ABC transporter substrate-binding protein [Burkholderiaceae bacterium]|jgi:iron(III) transport system substrate-binding protein|nr:putative 2-aminoethylphosphonate ABC transporter substrate-binding protein [Rhodoferax sp.]HQZ07115.1 putative 2-aminoethylphosphonate ABC transporter substrate-binding protein [Burkholderiaceae bacterium]HRA61295.1 putative 2-aminoethylphosphonate ABC transporter substrate-binding protein [Burkholderiaceae bacterium]
MFKPTVRKLLQGAAVVAVSALLAVPAFAQKTKLTVYTALENDQLGPYKQAFEAANNDVEIAWVRDSTGVITARLLAEKDNPRADVIWGLGASSIALFDSMGMLQGYTPKGADQIKPVFRSDKNPMMWTGMDAWLAVMCYNTIEGGKKNMPKPTSWADLANPVYKDSVVMPNPASSGTGYQAVYAWLQIMGEKAGWEFMDKLHQNIAVYTHSGSAPCVQAAKGERVIGIGFDMRGAKEKTAGAPIDIILAKEGAPWDMEATAIVKGTKNMAAAQKVADFAISKGAYELYGKYYAIVGYPGMNPAPPNYPPSADSAMVKIDLSKMGAERSRILAEWTKRYDGKSAPK